MCRCVPIYQDSCPVRGNLGSNKVSHDVLGAADGEGGGVGDRFFIGGHVGTCRVSCEREGWCPGRAHSLNLPVVTVDARQVMAVRRLG